MKFYIFNKKLLKYIIISMFVVFVGEICCKKTISTEEIEINELSEKVKELEMLSSQINNNDNKDINEKISKLRTILPKPDIFKQGDTNYNLAKTFLIRKGVEPKRAMQLIDKAKVFEKPECNGCEVFHFYANDTYGIAVLKPSQSINKLNFINKIDILQPELIKVIKFRIPKLYNKDEISKLSDYDLNEYNIAIDNFLRWFAPSYLSTVNSIEKEIETITDAELKNQMRKKISGKIDFKQNYDEAVINFEKYKNKIIKEYENNFVALGFYISYEAEKEEIWFSWGDEEDHASIKLIIPIKSMDNIFYKIKSKHEIYIKNYISHDVTEKEISMKLNNQTWAEGGKSAFENRMWASAEEKTRKLILMLCLNKTTNELVLIDKKDMEIYYKLENKNLLNTEPIIDKIKNHEFIHPSFLKEFPEFMTIEKKLGPRRN